jgi:hypothetical protein
VDANKLDSVPPLIREALTTLLHGARSILSAKRNLRPVLFRFITEDDKITQRDYVFVDSLVENSATKEIIRMLMERLVEEDQADFVIFLTEVWMAQVKPDELEETMGRVSEREDKEEAVLASVMTKTRQIVLTACITRDPTEVGEFKVISDEGKMEGTLVRDQEDTPPLH